uniref:Hematopoietic cell signal transducer n=1 Tax=Oncorhynchus tshawytscha TaxID=74940 RepID=A0A8C8JNZ4_ONCTS
KWKEQALIFLMFSILNNPSCYRIEPGSMAGIIAADVILTLAVVIVTYHCASRRRCRKERGKSAM